MQAFIIINLIERRAFNDKFLSVSLIIKSKNKRRKINVFRINLNQDIGITRMKKKLL